MQTTYPLPPGPTINRPEDLANALYKHFKGETREKMLVAVMDGANRITAVRMVSYGSAVACMFPLREILHAALVADGVGFAISHNHPSGNPSFSVPDIHSTRRVQQAAETVGLRFIDHVIIAGQGRWASYVQTCDPAASWPSSNFSPVAKCVETPYLPEGGDR